MNEGREHTLWRVYDTLASLRYGVSPQLFLRKTTETMGRRPLTLSEKEQSARILSIEGEGRPWPFGNTFEAQGHLTYVWVES